jgi:formylglycine-generating enzyme required for sulfatase activity
MSCGAKILLKDRYRALKLLGQGGFGKTFKAVDEDQPHKPLCVIKQFAFSNNHPETRQIALKLFYEEAQHLEALGKHDQIPELTAYFDVEGQPYLVQQFIDGQDLEQELATAGTFNQAKIRKLLESLLPVLDFLHHQSPPVIHRDIKPANIIRRRSDGVFVLVDFGAAKLASQTMLAKTGTVIGSPEYTAPEQTRGKPVFASDIYSLGVTCIYLLTQVSPFDLFDLSTDAWVWRDYLVKNPVDEKLGKVLDKMIANSLNERYRSIAEVLAALGHMNNHSKAEFTSLSKNTSPKTSIHQSVPIKIIRQKFKFETVKTEMKKGFFGFKYKSSEIPSKAEYITEYFGNGVNIDMIYIPVGSFIMGSHEHVEEQPIHQVTLSSFYMSEYAITQKQYKEIMGDNPSKFKGENRPVESVSWDNAIEFCQKLSQLLWKPYTLPTESQWEYACRAGTETPFYFGQIITPDLGNYNGSHTYRDTSNGYRQETTDVGSFPPNAFGLYDMHGNVREWCLDTWNEDYKKVIKDTIELTSKDKVLRGGSWADDFIECRSAARTHSPLPSWGIDGFRVVFSPSLI